MFFSCNKSFPLPYILRTYIFIFRQMNSGANILVYINLGSWFFNIIAAKEGSLVDISWYNYHFYWLLNCEFSTGILEIFGLYSLVYVQNLQVRITFYKWQNYLWLKYPKAIWRKKILGIPSLFLFLVCSLTSQNSAILSMNRHITAKIRILVHAFILKTKFDYLSKLGIKFSLHFLPRLCY